MHGSVPGPLHIILRLLACRFVGLLTVKADVSLIHLSALGILFILLGSLVQSQCEGFCLVLFYILLCHVWLMFLGGLHFSEEVEEMEEEWIWSRGEMGASWKEWREGKPWLGFLYKRRIYFLKEKKNSEIRGSKKKKKGIFQKSRCRRQN